MFFNEHNIVQNTVVITSWYLQVKCTPLIADIFFIALITHVNVAYQKSLLWINLAYSYAQLELLFFLNFHFITGNHFFKKPFIKICFCFHLIDRVERNAISLTQRTMQIIQAHLWLHVYGWLVGVFLKIANDIELFKT